MSEENKASDILGGLQESLKGFAESVFGESGKDFISETSKKIKEFSSSSVKKFVEFADSVISKMNLNENEQVMKARDSIEEMLKQGGWLEDDNEEDF